MLTRYNDKLTFDYTFIYFFTTTFEAYTSNEHGRNVTILSYHAQGSTTADRECETGFGEHNIVIAVVVVVVVFILFLRTLSILNVKPSCNFNSMRRTFVQQPKIQSTSHHWLLSISLCVCACDGNENINLSFINSQHSDFREIKHSLCLLLLLLASFRRANTM